MLSVSADDVRKNILACSLERFDPFDIFHQLGDRSICGLEEVGRNILSIGFRF